MEIFFEKPKSIFETLAFLRLHPWFISQQPKQLKLLKSIWVSGIINRIWIIFSVPLVIIHSLPNKHQFRLPAQNRDRLLVSMQSHQSISWRVKEFLSLFSNTLLHMQQTTECLETEGKMKTTTISGSERKMSRFVCFFLGIIYSSHFLFHTWCDQCLSTWYACAASNQTCVRNIFLFRVRLTVGIPKMTLLWLFEPHNRLGNYSNVAATPSLLRSLSLSVFLPWLEESSSTHATYFFAPTQFESKHFMLLSWIRS